MQDLKKYFGLAQAHADFENMDRMPVAHFLVLRGYDISVRKTDTSCLGGLFLEYRTHNRAYCPNLACHSCTLNHVDARRAAGSCHFEDPRLVLIRGRAPLEPIIEMRDPTGGNISDDEEEILWSDSEE